MTPATGNVRDITGHRNGRLVAIECVGINGDGRAMCGWHEAKCDVHHRVPKSLGGLHSISNAVVLCPNCHRLEHEGGRRIALVDEIGGAA